MKQRTKSGRPAHERTDAGAETDSVVVLEEGDAACVPREDAEPPWDWDADAVAGPMHCEQCGALGPLFRREDGSLACRACHHLHVEAPASSIERAPSDADAPSRGFLEPELAAVRHDVERD